MRDAVEANAADLLAYLERRVDPRSEAADILGDAMLTAWRKVGDLPSDPQRARMWLFVVARNTLLNRRRALSRQRDAVERLRQAIVSDISTGPPDDFEHVDMRTEVQSAIDSLDAEDAEIVRLVNWDGFTLAEIAELQGMPPSTVRSRYAKALRVLETRLARDRSVLSES